MIDLAISNILATTSSSSSSGGVGTFIMVTILAIIMVGYVWGKIDEEKSKKQRYEQKRLERERRYRQRQAEKRYRYERWRRLKDEYEELKKTDLFKNWKAEQYLCQDKKCAWCKRPIGLHTQYTHVDHIEPLFYGGDNDLNNLVLACSTCNRAKGYKTYGYNDNWNGDKNHRRGANAKPSWIKENRYAVGNDQPISGLK